ncbi:MAG: pantoate--beta-alanine ligase [Actinobacteria bacterium]|uniref:pantoate--beta-alanine ligase (AMP-forming) n=1 Tax=freshwater metagenome TaxID=449393 RepID=A0A6J7H679_9ZZZZ|nr:pantoate--beta-alanine ligase [Actinomycetota bacterium]MSW91484.1 pantoate--beta-alanine ligase [Actinomycetota bacterium]MSX88823.1 pantoate--beta-alanine ligase [Actinomycetota bacterium]MSY71664.1 pantoate--beta-alanine ligase [Actinomycetota bacterium]
MKTYATIAAFREALDTERHAGRAVGLVPTMGYLHDGHRSLMDAAVVANGVAALTIFVNPLQFAPTEDLSTYPRDLQRDLAMARSAGIGHVFTPDVAEMYPEAIATTVSVAGVSSALEGASRPTHFDGVATVVAKLFAIAGPCRAYFGEKDFQQLAVVRKMTSDLSLPVAVVGCPTVRESDGLAMSSRNVYLNDAERAAAPVLHRALRAGREAIEQGVRDAAAVRAVMAEVIAAEPLARLDYAEVVDAATFVVPAPLAGTLRLLVAVRFAKARLIDNIGVLA